MMTFIFCVMFFSGLIVFSLNRKHLLVMLLSLEFIVLSLYFFILILLSYFNYESFLLMVYLTVCVCEGVLGLSILVTMIRTLGNDYVLTFSALW